MGNEHLIQFQATHYISRSIRISIPRLRFSSLGLLSSSALCKGDVSLPVDLLVVPFDLSIPSPIRLLLLNCDVFSVFLSLDLYKVTSFLHDHIFVLCKIEHFIIWSKGIEI